MGGVRCLPGGSYHGLKAETYLKHLECCLACCKCPINVGCQYILSRQVVDDTFVRRALFGFLSYTQPVKYIHKSARLLRHWYMKRTLPKQEMLCGNCISIRLARLLPTLQGKPAETLELRSEDGQAPNRRAIASQ